MHVKWMDKMVVIVKCQFLVSLTKSLHQFAFVNPMKFHEQIEELSKFKPVVKSTCQYVSLLKIDSLSNMSCKEGHFAFV